MIIKRTVNGVEMKFKLTASELDAAWIEADKKNTYDDVTKYLKENSINLTAAQKNIAIQAYSNYQGTGHWRDILEYAVDRARKGDD